MSIRAAAVSPRPSRSLSQRLSGITTAAAESGQRQECVRERCRGRYGAGAEPAELSPEDRFRAACMSGDGAAARAALEDAPDSLNDAGALQAAASLGNVAALRCMLNLGADANATTDDGTTALHQAAWHDQRVAAEVLVAHGARPLRDANHESTPAGWANHAGHAAMRDYLLDHCPDGFDLISFGRLEALRRYLAEHPGFATGTLPGGGTPLHHLRDDIDHLEQVVAALLESGADLAARDDGGETPRESAVRRGCPVKLIGAAGQVGDVGSSLAHPGGDVTPAMQRAPHVDVVVAFAVEDQIRVAPHGPRAESRHIQFPRMPR